MSSASSESKRSTLGWKITAVVFIVLTVGASALAYYYYGQNQNNISSYVSKAADRNYYYSQWQSDESQIATMNQQISSDNTQIASDRTTIANDQATIASDKTTIANDRIQIALLQSELYNPACQPNCDSTIAQLNAQINSLNAQITIDSNQIAADTVLIQSLNNQIAACILMIQSLNNQISNLRDILGIKKSQVIASGLTKNQPQCGEINQPSCQGSSACSNPSNCTPQYILPSDMLSFCSQSCYQGVLVISWTSTQSMTISFASSYQGSTAIAMSSSSTSSGDFAFPIIANFSSTGGLSTNGFHNDSCTKDSNGNYHCAAVSLTYSETFDY